jgi:outer membrane autotransporter protein
MMKRLFVSAALLPLLHAGSAHAETKISTATTAPVATATLAAGQRDDLTIEVAGSIKPTVAGAAVTLNSNNIVKNAGAIGFNNLDGSRGILVQGGFAGSVSNTGSITLTEDYQATDADNDGDLDGLFATGGNRIGIYVTGPAGFTGDIRNEGGGTISIEGVASAGIRADTRITGHLASAGTIAVSGDRSAGIRATDVGGNVVVTGSVAVQGEDTTAVSLGNVGGTVQIQGSVTSTGYRGTSRLDDVSRAKLDADDLKQGGPALAITGNVGRGVILDTRPADASTTDTDEDDDGIEDALEGTSVVTSTGSAPAIDIGSTIATTLGVVGTGDNAYGLVIKGTATALGVNDGVPATAIRIGLENGRALGNGLTTVQGGIHVAASGKVSAVAYGTDVVGGGGPATAVLINSSGVVPALRNAGTIEAGLGNGQHDSRAVVDLSGTLSLVENTGAITSAVTPKAGQTAVAGQAIALDLRANTTGAVVRQTLATATSVPVIQGDVLLGSGADRIELLGGRLTGAMAFGAGADSFVIDGGGSATGRLTDTDGVLALDVRDGRLSLTNSAPIQVSSLNLGAKGVLAVSIDPAAGTATRLNVSGAATVASGAQFDLTLNSLLRQSRSYEIVRAGTLQIGTAGANLLGAPFLYATTLRTDTAANALYVDLRPKTAAEIGLNRSGGQAYAAVFDALDKDDKVETAFLSQKTQAGFLGLYDQMLPDHSGAALMSAHAISGAISSAISQPVARDEIGGTGVWAQEILFRIDRDRGDALGFKSKGFGLAAGMEAVGQVNAVGINASFVTTEYRDRGAATGEQVAMNFFEGGVYWRLNAAGFKADARAGAGYVSFESDRKLSTPGLSLANQADWSGWLADAHAGASYEVRAGWLYARPEVSVDYLRLSEKSYDETGGGAGFDLSVDDRKGDLLTGEALLAIGARFGTDFYWQPELKVGWRQKLAGDPGTTTARFAGGSEFTLDPEDVYSGGLIARLGLKGGTKQVVYAIDAGGAFDDDYREYDLRAIVRFLF